MAAPRWTPEAKVVSLGSLRPAKRNARRHTEPNLAAIRESLERFGQREALVVRKGEVVGGNARLSVMRELKFDQVLTISADDLSEKEALRLAIALNRSGELAEWDAVELAAQNDLLGGLPGFTQADLDEINAQANPVQIIEDEAPEPPKKAVTKPGDAWTLGKHRLVCGDAGDQKNVRLATGRAFVDFLFTSPPYNVNVEYGEHSDETMPWDEYGKQIRRVVAAWAGVLAPGRAIGWNIGSSRKTYPWRQVAMFEELGLRYIRTLVWQKVGVPVPLFHNTRDKPVARNFHPNYTHELVMMFGKGDRMEHGEAVHFDDSLENDVFRLNQSDATRGMADDPSAPRSGARSNLETRWHKAHPAPFPVKLPAIFIRHMADVGAIVADPYMGSGTTIIACEQTERVACGTEIDPRYVDVAVERWQNLTGGKAKRNGTTQRTRKSRPAPTQDA